MVEKSRFSTLYGFLFALIVFVDAGGDKRKSNQAPPNVLFIVADDLGENRKDLTGNTYIYIYIYLSFIFV